MLYGKSKSSGVSLLQHTRDVVESVEVLFGREKPTRLTDCWLRFFGVRERATFRTSLTFAAALHDIGKANNGFQGAVTNGDAQSIRHEHLSGLLMALPEVDAWLRSKDDVDGDVVLSAVISHHLKVKRDTFAQQLQPDRNRVRIESMDDDFEGLTGFVQSTLGLEDTFPPVSQPIWDFYQHPSRHWIRPHREEVLKRLSSLENQLRRDDARRRMLMAVRSALIAADSFGSAMRREGISIKRWSREAFNEANLCDEAFVQQSIIRPRVDELNRQGKWQEWSEFQNHAERLPSRSLLLAPCGSGKTLAAWRWIAAQCRNPVKRIIFLYPTRGTASEGFRDYVSWAPESDAALIHGTADFDLVDMFENGDERHEKSYQVRDRLFALGFWTKKVFAATVDQFLGFLQHAYGSTCLLPVLVDSVVVIDEIHSFDPRMYAALKDFLNTFDVPVLCMTASLPESRRNELIEDCNLHQFADQPGELKDIAEKPRYRIQVCEELSENAWIDRKVREALKNGKRILWVVNTVRRAQEATLRIGGGLPSNDQLELTAEGGAPLICYHSRFRLNDRRERHDKTIRTFQNQNDGPALAITTQVCEMSLDLDADVLVTEVAPVTSLIQRMGRCNRKRETRCGAGEVIIYQPEKDHPYDEADLEGVDEFLTSLQGEETLSQNKLAELLAGLQFRSDLPRECAFVSGSAYADSREETLREIDEFTIPGVLDKDVPEFLVLMNERKPTAGLIVPVPRGLRREETREGIKGANRLPRYLTVVLSDSYDKRIGFSN